MAMHLETTETKILLVGEKDIWIPINRSIARILGKNAAEVLQLVHYWTKTNSGALINGRRWIYNTYNEWSKQLGIAKSTLRAVIYILEKAGILLSGNFNKKKSDRTKWYTIAYDVLKRVVGVDQEEVSSSPKNKPVDNSSTWSVETQHMYNEAKITAGNSGLNYACARETSQPMVEECKQPRGAVSTVVESTPAAAPTSAPKAHQGDVIEDLESNPIREAESNAVVMEQEPVSEPTPETKSLSEVVDPEPQTLTEPNLTVDEFVDKAYEIVQEIIGSKLDHPLSINMGIFARTIKKRMGTHFGLGALGLSRLREYCQAFADTPFLMGQKAMKSGDRFTVSIGSILSAKRIEERWEKSKFWKTWPPKEPTPEELQAAEDARQLEASERQALSLEEALTTAQDSVDKEVKQKLYQALGTVTYRAWIVATGFVARGFENGEPIFDINSAFARDYLFTHHEQQIRNAFACGMGRN